MRSINHQDGPVATESRVCAGGRKAWAAASNSSRNPARASPSPYIFRWDTGLLLRRTRSHPARLCRVAGVAPCITLRRRQARSVPGNQSKTPVISVAIVEDQNETREGLSFLIHRTEGFECRHVYASMEAALAGIGARPPRVALVDIGLPGMSGIHVLRIMRQRHPSIAAVLLSVFKDGDRIFQAVCAGACGYLLKKTPPARLLEALREIAEGGAAMSPEVAIRVVELFRKTQTPEQLSAGLSPQEGRLLKLLSQRRQNKTATCQIGISIHT